MWLLSFLGVETLHLEGGDYLIENVGIFGFLEIE